MVILLDYSTLLSEYLIELNKQKSHSIEHTNAQRLFPPRPKEASGIPFCLTEPKAEEEFSHG